MVYQLLSRFLPGFPNVAVTLVLVSLLASLLGYLKIPMDDSLFLQPISSNLWKVTLPVLDFVTVRELVSTSLAIATLCVLEGTSIGKSLAARAGHHFNPHQAMLATGMANIGSAFFSGMPASGSLTRSQLAYTSGAATPMVGMVIGLTVVVGAFTIGPLIGYIPKASLAILVILIGLSLINLKMITMVVRSTRADAIVYFVTLASGLLLALDLAVFLGVALSIFFFLRQAGTPETMEYDFNSEGELTELGRYQSRKDPEISIVHVEGSLFFGAAELFQEQMRRASRDPALKVVILKMRNAHHIDATSVMALEELVHSMKEHRRILLFSEVRKKTIRVFKRSGLLQRMDRHHIFLDVPSTPNLSTARALKRAQTLLGEGNVRVSIYVDELKHSMHHSKGEGTSD